jgi:hypothetical protein
LFHEEHIQQVKKLINDWKHGNPTKTNGQKCRKTKQRKLIDVIRLQFHERKQPSKPSRKEYDPHKTQQQHNCNEGEYSKNGPSGKRDVSRVRDSIVANAPLL